MTPRSSKGPKTHLKARNGPFHPWRSDDLRSSASTRGPASAGAGFSAAAPGPLAIKSLHVGPVDPQLVAHVGQRPASVGSVPHQGLVIGGSQPRS
jgi:hypothetical protein